MTRWPVLLGAYLLASSVAVTDAVPAETSSRRPIQLSLPSVSPSAAYLKALSAAAQNNPDVLLYKERIRRRRGQVQTQFGAMLPNLSANVRQTRQTQFLGTIALSPYG
ncbi:MAG: TolC family protein [Nitrospira sp.]|nr:TolC family protein [Nitrospira sp.]